MRPASKVAEEVCAGRFWSIAEAAAVIQRDREELVREIVAWLEDKDLRNNDPVTYGSIAQKIRDGEYLG